MIKRIKLFFRLWQVGIRPADAWKQAEVIANMPRWNGQWGRK